MKTKTVKLILTCGALLFALLLVDSCSKDDPKVVIDKVALNAAITAAMATQGAAVEGTAAGQYEVGAKATFQTAIDAAQAVASNASATQAEVTNVTTALANAAAVFATKLIEEIDPDNLIAYWKFDEGTGTSAADASGNSHAGVLTAGHSSLAGGIPTWAADRKGVAAKSLHFTKGGHVLVPSNGAFGPTEITISLWIKLDSLNTTDCNALNGRCVDGVFADNYMISQNSYLGYKFQTQEGKKPFFTVKTAPDTYINQDSETGVLKLKKWYQVAVTFKTGTMTFYLNGAQVREVPGLTGGFVTLADRFDFVIGQELPNAKVDPNISWVLPHFEGFMDEVRIYKKVLTATQITSIYNQEKP